MSKFKVVLMRVMATLVLSLEADAQAVPISGDIDISCRLNGTAALNPITALNLVLNPLSRVVVADGDFAAMVLLLGLLSQQ